jgi:hypothetical protein
MLGDELVLSHFNHFKMLQVSAGISVFPNFINSHKTEVALNIANTNDKASFVYSDQEEDEAISTTH